VPLQGRVIAKTRAHKLALPAIDLSIGGVAFGGSRGDRLGEPVQVDFDLEGNAGRISAEGVVVSRSRRQGRWVWGVEFRKMHPRTADAIDRYVKWRLGKGPRPYASVEPV
jgi:c-di-GMP-binding flagellar brake protein YcgR